MLLFLKKSLLFISALVFPILFLIFIGNVIIPNHLKNSKINLNTTQLLLGDSHIQNALNDGALNNYTSLAYHAESYYFSYYKLKILLDANPQLETLYLGFSYHNLSNYYDDYISGKYSNAISSEYFFILPLKEQVNCIYWNKNSLLVFMQSNIKYGLKNLVESNYFSFKGGYKNSYISNTATKASMDKRILAQYYENNTVRGFSEINYNYLVKIIKLCKLNNIKLTLVNTPLHNYYKSQIPKTHIENYDAIIDKYSLEVFDFEKLKMSDDCFVKDGDHVTRKGSNITTNYFFKHIKD